MRYISTITLLLNTLFIMAFSGCTKVELPPAKTQEPESLTIISEKQSILDTEPLILACDSKDKSPVWSFKPEYPGGYFTPQKGLRVVFVPPDVNTNTDFTITVTNINSVTSSVVIHVIDEGDPPSPGDILINELAWAGTLASSYDEYIELINKTKKDFYLNNWIIENAAGTNSNLLFSGLIKKGGFFLIANYSGESGKSSITVDPDCIAPKISLSNSTFGPFILKNSNGTVMDTVGDGGSYTAGKNTSSVKASMARYTGSNESEWLKDSWYTEGVSLNLSDGSFGTPGAKNSNKNYSTGISEDNAKGLIVKYYVDAHSTVGDDWAEIIITKSGDIKNFILTDLDGSDESITNGQSIKMNKDDRILVIWGDDYNRNNNYFTIPDTNPTGTKDELVLLCGDFFMDCLCYYSTEEVQFDDEEKIIEYGWSGPPVPSKYGTRNTDENGDYVTDLNKRAWNIEEPPEPF